MKYRTVFWGIIAVIIFVTGGASADWGVPPSAIIGSGPVASEASIVMPVPDVQQWQAEDLENESKGVPMRIGAERLLAPDVMDQAERIIDDEYGLIWRLEITSPDAFELKVYLTDIHLAGLNEIYIYGPDDSESEIYTREDVYEDQTLWSWGTPGETVIVEWHHDVAPDGSYTEPVDVPFAVKSISHIYKDFETIITTREGSCHNDATCDAAFRPERNASAHIEFNDGGTYICSGTMLNSAAQNFNPYFLTANHCVSTNTVANSVKAWFFYHTENCNDPPPARGFRTVSGASLLATAPAQSGNGTDFSLLQLSNADYTGVYFAGWDRTPLNIGDPVTCIHHPDGAYKRISYGTVRSTWYNGQWGVNWDRTANPGVTEGGSSGSAIFHANTHRVAGQLWAGSSSCSNQNGRDFYGRFPLSFQNGNLGQWLGNVTYVDGAYWNSGGPTPTPPPPTFTPTPRPSGTAQPTNTPNPSWTPTPVPALTVDIVMPSNLYHPGDPFGCSVILTNNGSSTFQNLPLFVILDVYGSLFFLPGYSAFDYYSVTVPPGPYTQIVVPTFNWPSGAGNAGNIWWYAGCTNQSFTELFGGYDAYAFGWTEP